MTKTATRPQLNAAAAATFLIFGINGLVFASWAARIPAVTDILDISSGQMGTLLLCVAAGSLIALPTAGHVVGRIGTANAVRAAGLVAAAAGVGVALALLAESIPGTAIALFFFGMGIGLWDVSQNIEGADVEHQLGRTIMPQFHAAFSGGAFLGALIGAGLAGLGVGLPAHLLVIAAIVAAVTLAAPRYFLPHIPAPAPVAGEARESKGRSAWRDGRTLLIGVVVLGATLTEGAGNDWIAKAAVDGLDATEVDRCAAVRGLCPGHDRGALLRRPGDRRLRPGACAPCQHGRRRRGAGAVRPGRQHLDGHGRRGALGRRGGPGVPDGNVGCGRRSQVRSGPRVSGLHDRVRRVPGRPAAAGLPW